MSKLRIELETDMDPKKDPVELKKTEVIKKAGAGENCTVKMKLIDNAGAYSGTLFLNCTDEDDMREFNTRSKYKVVITDETNQKTLKKFEVDDVKHVDETTGEEIDKEAEETYEEVEQEADASTEEAKADAEI